MYKLFCDGFLCAYAELYLGVYDIGRGHIRSDNRKDGGYYECGVGFCRGCGVFVHHHDWSDGVVGRADGDCAEVRVDCKADQRDTAVH